MTTKSPLTRRAALTMMTGTALAAGSALCMPHVARAATGITVRDQGGVFTQAFTEAFYKPFQKETGVEVLGVAGAANPAAQIKAMVETASYTWDAAILTRDIYQDLYAAKLLEPLDQSGPDVSEMPAEMKAEGWLGIDVYAFVSAYRPDIVGATGPKNFAEFWDVDRFKGTRALRKFPRETIEAALRADGVAPGDDIYKVLSTPAGWDRAFKKLDQIKKHIAVWWSNTSETAQLLRTGQAALCPTFISQVRVVKEAGTALNWTWQDGFYGVEGFSVLKGTPKADIARKFVKFCARADRQAVFTQFVANGPANPAAIKYVDQKHREFLPTDPANFSAMQPVNETFWAQNRATALERFQTWLIT